jgi:hypothetical protein
MNADTTQENRGTIEKNLGAANFDCSETNLVLKLVLAGLDMYPIESWILWRPEL